jgi:hypothetical protein
MNVTCRPDTILNRRGHGANSAARLRFRKVASACAISLIFEAAAMADAFRPENVGRFVSLGRTEAPRGWKSQHPADLHLLYRMDSATGAIETCGDVEGVCRTIPGSERDSTGLVVRRFAAMEIAPATAAWKAGHATDDHLIYSLDSTTGEIQVCGNLEGTCAVAARGRQVAPDPWPRVVIVYRRADSAAIAGRIYDRLVAHYGRDAVFMDIYSIPLAADWREEVKLMSLNGGALIALVGPQWLGRLADGRACIDDIDDPVRAELESALDAHVPVFPVLVEGATMPRTAELPDSLKVFSNINAAIIATGREFDAQVARLIGSIDQHLASGVAPAAAQQRQ